MNINYTWLIIGIVLGWFVLPPIAASIKARNA